MPTGTTLGTGVGTSGAVTVTLTTGAPAGSLIIVAGLGNSTVTSFAVNDSKSNTWTTDQTSALSATPTTATVLAHSILTSALAAGDTVTCTLNAGATGREAFIVTAFDGIDTAAPLDGSATAVGKSTTATVGSTGTLAQANGLVFFAVANAVSATCSTPTGYTAGATVLTTGGTNERRMSVFWKVPTTTAAESPSSTIGSSTAWAASLSEWKPGTAAPPAGPTVTVWNGTTELPVASVTVWNGTSEAAATIELAP